MSTRNGRERVRVQRSVLDRLTEDASAPGEPAQSDVYAMESLQRSVRRDLEALLNARRRWRSWPAWCSELRLSPLGYGIPDFASGAFSDSARREALRADVESTIRRFETRLSNVRVSLLDGKNRLEPSLRLRIEALLRAEPAPAPVAFDTIVDPVSVVVRPP
ncbi:MAG: type VI secretion system baseplate subunit TssE, partial [Acetobacteraceae bacterium]|nr:type VI secretion system baseplate subunit TssE [Acetobacteraceae bacterium]